MPNSPRPYRHGLAILALSLVGLPNAQAEIYTWQGNPQSTDAWSAPFSWTRPGLGSGYVPVSSYDTTLLFNASSFARLDSRNNLGVFKLGNLTFGGRDGWTITGDGLDFATGTITADTSASVANAISVASGLTSNVALGKTLALSGAITGAGSLIKSGSGILALSGAVTAAGGLTLNAGTVNLTGTLGNSVAYVPTILTGGTLNLSNQAYVSNLTLASGSTVVGSTVNLSGNATVNGTVASNLALTNAAHSFSGNGTISGVLSGPGTFGVASGSNITLASGGGYTFGGAIGLAGTLTTNVAAAQTFGFSGAIAGAGSLVKSGEGALTLSGAVTPAGGLVVNAGTVDLTGTLGNSAAYVPTILSGGTLNLSNAAYVSNLTLATGTTVAGAGSLNLSGNVEFGGQEAASIRGGTLATNVVVGAGSHGFTGLGTVSGKISGSGGVNVGGDVNFNAANTYTGGTFVNGILSLYATDSLPKGGALSMLGAGLYINEVGGTAPITQTVGNLSGTGFIIIGSRSDTNRDLHNTLVLDTSAPSSLQGLLIGFGDFVKRGASRFEYFVDRSSFGGLDTPALGRLNIEQGTMTMAGEQSSALYLDIAAGTTLDQSSAGLRVFRGFTGAGALRLNGPLTLDDVVSNYTGTISGAGALSISHSRPDLYARPVIDLSNANLSGYTGAISVSNSTLSIANTTTNSTVSLTNGAILNVREDSFQDAASFGQVTGTTGTTLAKTGAGTLRVGNLSFGGQTRVDGGTLLVNRDTIYRSTDGISVAQGATLGFGGGSAGVATKTLTNAGTIVGSGGVVATVTNGATGTVRTNPAERLTLTGDVTNNGTFSLVSGGEIGVAGKLTNAAGSLVTGQGTLTTDGLISSGTMAFSGGVSNVYGKVGLLSGSVVQNSGAGALTFWDDVTHNGTEIRTNAGSYTTFKGSVSGAGAFTGLGTVEFDGDLRPGNSPASVSFAGDLILANTNTLVMELGGTTLGTGYDHLNVGGTAYLDGMLNVVTYNGFNPMAGQSFDLFDFTGQRGTFRSVNLPTLANNMEWNTSGLYTTGKISVQAVPEPASLAALAVGGLALLRRRRAKTA